MRRDLMEMMERQARDIELRHRMTAQFDAGLTDIREEIGRTRGEMTTIRSDLVLTQNRILSAITEMRMLAARVDGMPIAAPEADEGSAPAAPRG